jgi:nucleotide-binding universal stress UspA family protein
MQQINSILVCVHPDSADLSIVDRAVGIAKSTGAAIKLLHVVSEYPEDMSEWWNVRNPQKLHDKIVKERGGFLADLQQQLKDQGVEKVTHELRWGRQFLEITREAVRGKHDLVMITSQHPSKIARTMLECPSMDLMRHCPCPLWVSKGKLARRHKRVLAAIGWKGGQVQCDAMNAKIMRIAATLAKADGCEFHLAHALPLYGGKGLKGNKLRSDLVDYLDKLREEIIGKCAPNVKRLGITVTQNQVHLLTGTPSVVIPDLVTELGIDLVVMGTIVRTGIPGLLIGNTAEKVFDQVSCAIVTIKPDDFVSLVEKEEQG